MSREEILKRVGRIVSEVLKVASEEVNLTASLQEDLGAESIDYLEIVSDLEDEFEIDIPDEEPFLGREFYSEAWGMVRDGRLTEKGLATIQEKHPYYNLEKVKAEDFRGRLAYLYTLEMIVDYIDYRLNAKRLAPHGAI